MPSTESRAGRRWPPAVLLAAALCGGCGGPPAPGPERPPASSAPAPARTSSAAATPRPTAAFDGLELARSGGFAGVQESVTIQANGDWQRLDGTRVVARGTLTARQRAELAGLAADPALAAEARRTDPPNRCADGFVYLLNTNHLLVRHLQCGTRDRHPVTEEIIDLVAVITR